MKQYYSRYLDDIYDEAIEKQERYNIAILANRRMSKPANAKKQAMQRAVLANTRRLNRHILDCVLDEAINHVILANLLEKRQKAILAWQLPWSKKKEDKEEYTEELQEAYDKVFSELQHCKSLVELHQICNPKESTKNQPEQKIKTQFFNILHHYATQLSAIISSMDSSSEVNEDTDFNNDDNWQELEDSIYVHMDMEPAKQVKYFLSKVNNYKHNILQDMPDKYMSMNKKKLKSA